MVIHRPSPLGWTLGRGLCTSAAADLAHLPCLELGLERAHSVAILGSNSPEWFFSAVGTVFAG